MSVDAGVLDVISNLLYKINSKLERDARNGACTFSRDMVPVGQCKNSAFCMVQDIHQTKEDN